MMFRSWGVFALSLAFGFSMFAADTALAARSVASGKQVKSAVRPAAKIASRKRIAPSVQAAAKRAAPLAVAVPAFRPPKPPAQRHYAVDGSSFYADGVRVSAAGVDGLDMPGASGMAKQRLQQLLDSGRVSIEPLGSDGGDVTLARVRVDGRDVSEVMSAR